MRAVLLFGLLFGVFFVSPAFAGDLAITVDGVPAAAGHVRVAVCRREEFLHPHCLLHAAAPARPGAVTLHLQVPPGAYAVQAWHDANDNMRIDRNLFGMPTERLGFSRDARLWFGPPRFDAAAIAVPEGPLAIRFPLRAVP